MQDSASVFPRLRLIGTSVNRDEIKAGPVTCPLPDRPHQGRCKSTLPYRYIAHNDQKDNKVFTFTPPIQTIPEPGA